MIDFQTEISENIVLTEGISITKVAAGYTLWLPESGRIQGMVVFTHPRRDTSNSDFLIDYALDLAAFINDLKIVDHPTATLIITEDRGYLPDGQRHPHSWNIVDKKELIDWFLALED